MIILPFQRKKASGGGGGPTTLLYDTFTDVEETPIYLHTPDIDTDHSLTWDVFGAGHWFIRSNKLESVSHGQSTWHTLLRSDCRVITTITQISGTNEPYIMFRKSDVNNFWMAGQEYIGNSLAIWKMQGGVLTQMATSYSPNVTGTVELTLECDGPNILISHSGYSTSYNSATFNQTAKEFGCWPGGPNCIYENYKIETLT